MEPSCVVEKYPDEDPITPETVHAGFMQLVKLLSLIHEDTVDSCKDQCAVIDWRSREQSQACIKQLECDVQQLNLMSMQQADLLTTHQWLKVVL